MSILFRSLTFDIAENLSFHYQEDIVNKITTKAEIFNSTNLYNSIIFGGEEQKNIELFHNISSNMVYILL